MIFCLLDLRFGLPIGFKRKQLIGLAAPTRGRVFSTLVVILSVCPNFLNLSVDLKT